MRQMAFLPQKAFQAGFVFCSKDTRRGLSSLPSKLRRVVFRSVRSSRRHFEASFWRGFCHGFHPARGPRQRGNGFPMVLRSKRPGPPPLQLRVIPALDCQLPFRQVNNWRRWLLENRNQALKLFPAFRVRAYREPTFKFKIIIGNRTNSINWLERRNDLAKNSDVTIRSFDVFTDMFDRQIFQNYADFHSTESAALEPLTKNKLANPFYCAYTGLAQCSERPIAIRSLHGSEC